MSDDNPFVSDDDPTIEPDNSGKALRKFAEEQKALVKQLQQQLTDAQKQLASRTLSDVFTKLGIGDKVRKFYTGEATEEAVTAWWKENAEVFGVDPGTGNDPTLSPEQQQQHAQINNVQDALGVGQDRGGAVSTETIMQNRQRLLSEGRTINDLDAALAQLGVPNTPIPAPVF